MFFYKTHTLVTSGFVCFFYPSVPLFSQIFRGLEICCYGPFTNMPTGKRPGGLQSPAPPFLYVVDCYRRGHLRGVPQKTGERLVYFSVTCQTKLHLNVTILKNKNKKTTSPAPLLRSWKAVKNQYPGHSVLCGQMG